MPIVTGIGAVSSLGRGVARIGSAMAEGWDGLAEIRRFDARALGVTFGGMVPEHNDPAHAAPGPVTCEALALAAAREAWQGAGLDAVAHDRIALVFGSSLGDSDVAIHQIGERIGDALGIAGPRLAVTTACASSANAIGLALDLLALGSADAVVAGGADVLTPLVLAGFHALGVLAAGKCAPFSEPAGTTLGEGAGFVILERDGGRVRGRFAVLGYGLSADAFHDTGPDPSGAGVARALRGALAHAALAPAAIDYVNAHGTGTHANDPAEWRAIQQVFGARADTLPVSASKSFLGHAQGAAGALELIATLVALERGTLPPTQRYTVPRPNSPRDPVAGPTARPGVCDHALAGSSGFGGANCALVIGRAGDAAHAAASAGRDAAHAAASASRGLDAVHAAASAGRGERRRRIALAGVGCIGPHGDGAPTLATRARGRAVAFRLEDIVPAADPRGLDPMTRFLLAATGRALAGAPVRAADRDRIGLVVGQAVASPESDVALHRTIAAHGLRGLSATLFARQVANASAGTCARMFGLRGAHSVVSAGGATGLLAFVYAAELLATRTDLDRIVAAGADELRAGAVDDTSEGAAAALLVARPGAVEVAGWAIAGPGRLGDAIAAALARAGRTRADLVVAGGAGAVPVRDAAVLVIDAAARDGAVPVIDAADLVGPSLGFTPAASVLLAADAVAGGTGCAVVAHAGGRSAACAIVLCRGEPDAT